jgi:predicted transglutaminase-like cysteine proteinase
MKVFIIILLFIFTSYSADFSSDSLIKRVESKYNRFAKNRFIALNELLKKLEKENISTKLEKVNDFFNNVGYGDDKDIYGISDYWASPYEFLAKDKGDCEDYAIAKFFALKHLGIPSSKIFLTYVRLDGAKDAHMILSYFETPSSEPLILDSIRKIIFPASQRTDLKPIYNFNPDIFDKGGNTAAHKKWDVVLKNFRENKI